MLVRIVRLKAPVERDFLRGRGQGTGQGLCTGGFPGSGSQKEELEIHGAFNEGFQKLTETFWKLLESFWKLP